MLQTVPQNDCPIPCKLGIGIAHGAGRSDRGVLFFATYPGKLILHMHEHHLTTLLFNVHKSRLHGVSNGVSKKRLLSRPSVLSLLGVAYNE